MMTITKRNASAKSQGKTSIPGLIASEWIGGPGNTFCRQEFPLLSLPCTAKLHIASDPHSYAIKDWQILPSKFPYDHFLLGGSFIKYRVFLNGTLVAAGPFRSLEDGVPLLMECEASSVLKKGKNSIAVHCRGEIRGFVLALDIRDEAGICHTIRSSSDWRQREANTIYSPVCWTRPGLDQSAKGGPSPGEYPEHIDGASYPQGWKNAEFDDSDWSSALVFGAAEDEFEICRTPSYCITPCQPVVINKLGPGHYLADFGRPVFGGVQLSGPEAGGAIELRLAEELQPNGHARFQLRTENCFQELWTFAPNSEPLSHFGTRMFRYAEILGWRGEFTAGQISAIALGAPFDWTRSEFHCSEPRLEKVWHLCRNTVAYTTADVFTDCLTRERLAYEADTYVTMLTYFATEGSLETSRRSLEYLVGHPSWPCEWWQTFIPLFHEYLLYSGDYDFVDRYYEFLRDRTSFHALMKAGIIRDFPRESIVDWPENTRDGFDFGPGNAVTNAFAYWDLDVLGRIAGFLGRDEDRRRFAALAHELREGFNKCLFDDATGLYVDSLGSRHSSFHANMYALRFGLVPIERRGRCLSFLKERGMACSVFAAQFLLEALFANGEEKFAVGLMTSEGERSWMEMIRHGAVATTESWLSDPKHNLSWAHPWGSSPANVIARHLFGLRPTEPGWKDFVFDPKPGGLLEGSLRIATVRGAISASFYKQGHGYRSEICPDFVSQDLVRNEPLSREAEVTQSLAVFK